MNIETAHHVRRHVLEGSGCNVCGQLALPIVLVRRSFMWTQEVRPTHVSLWRHSPVCANPFFARISVGGLWFSSLTLCLSFWAVTGNIPGLVSPAHTCWRDGEPLCPQAVCTSSSLLDADKLFFEVTVNSQSHLQDRVPEHLTNCSLFSNMCKYQFHSMS